MSDYNNEMICFGSKRKMKDKNCLPSGGLEPPIFGLGDRRLIHWATRADGDMETFLQNNLQVHTRLKYMFIVLIQVKGG